MAVIRATNFRQRNPLVEELERQAQIAALKGQSITPNVIATEAYGGQFPIGSVASKFLSTAAEIQKRGQAKNTELRELETANLVSEALNKGTVGTTEDTISKNIPILVDDTGQFYTTRVDPDLPILNKGLPSNMEEAEAINKASGGFGFGKGMVASILKDEGKTPETITIGKKDRTLIDKLKGELPAKEASNIGDLARIGNLDAQTIELQRRLNLPKRTLVNGFLRGKPASIIQELDPRTNALKFTDLSGNPLDPDVVANFSTKKGSIPTLAEYIADEAPGLMQTGERDPSKAIQKATQIYNAIYGADAQPQQNISVQPSMISDPIEAELDSIDVLDSAEDVLSGNTNNNRVTPPAKDNTGDGFYEAGSKQEAEKKKTDAQTASTIVGTDKKKKEIEKLDLDIDKIKFDKIKDKQAFTTQIKTTVNDLELALSSANRIKDLIQYGGAKGFITKNIPGSGAYMLNMAIQDLANQNLLRKLSEMKQQTTTGASGLGQLNQKEGDALRNAFGGLDFFRKDVTIETADRIVKQLKQSIENYKSYYKTLYDEDFV